MSTSIKLFRIQIINIPANTEVKILNIREGISIQKTIRDRNSKYRIMTGSIITKYVNS